MAITDAEAARQMAEQYPDLHESRQIAFGQNYLQDLEEGKGTAQYYTGFGLAPDWVTGAIGAPAAQEPVVQDPTTMIPQTGGEGITAASVVQPTGGGAQNPLTQMITDPTTGQTQTVKQAMTSPAAYNIPGQMPKTPVSGAWGPQEQFQDQGPRVTLPSGDVFATDDPMLQEKMDYTEKTPAWWESARDKFIETGQDVGGFFGDLKDKGIDVGKMAGSAIMNMIAPGLGLITQLPISSASGAQQDLVRDQLVDSGVVLDDIGRIVQTGDYNTPENVMAGYIPGQTGLQIGDLKIGGGTVQHSAAERINDIQNTIDNLDENWSQLKASDPEAFEAKKQNLIDRQEALKEFINMGAAEAAGGVRLEDWDPENKIAGEVVYGTDHFPELGQEDTAPIDDIDEGFQTRFTAKDEGAWKGPGEISGVAGKTIVDPDTYMGSTVEGGLGLRGTIDRTDAYPDYSEVTGVEPPSEIYRDPIMEMAAEQAAKENALQEELEAYRDPIMDMEPAESVDLADIEGKDPRIVPEEQGLEGYPWLGYEDPIMERAEQEAREAEQRAAEQAAAQREMQEAIARAEAQEAARQAEIDRQNREADARAAEAARAAQAAREKAAAEAAARARDRHRGNGGNQGGNTSSGGGYSRGDYGGRGHHWSKGGIVGLKNAKR